MFIVRERLALVAARRSLATGTKDAMKTKSPEGSRPLVTDIQEHRLRSIEKHRMSPSRRGGQGPFRVSLQVFRPSREPG